MCKLLKQINAKPKDDRLLDISFTLTGAEEPHVLSNITKQTRA